MKQIFLILASILLSLSSSAQITLERSIPGASYVSAIKFSASGDKFYYFDQVTKTSVFLNPDYSIWKTITVPPMAGHNGPYVAYMSDHLYDSDDDVELVVYWTSTTAPYHPKWYLYDEVGGTTFSFGTASYMYQTYINGAYKLISNSYDTVCRVYSLPGTLPCGRCSGAAGVPKPGAEEIEAGVSPNPTNGVVAVNYDVPAGVTAIITVTNIEGKVIEEKPAASGKSPIIIDLTNYPSGLYQYKVAAPGKIPASGIIVR